LFSSRGQGKNPGTSLLADAVPETQAFSGQRAAQLIKQRVPVRCWRLCCVPSFYVVTVHDMQPEPHNPRRALSPPDERVAHSRKNSPWLMCDDSHSLKPCESLFWPLFP
jgi:hypothetical protein